MTDDQRDEADRLFDPVDEWLTRNADMNSAAQWVDRYGPYPVAIQIFCWCGRKVGEVQRTPQGPPLLILEPRSKVDGSWLSPRKVSLLDALPADLLCVGMSLCSKDHRNWIPVREILEPLRRGATQVRLHRHADPTK